MVWALLWFFMGYLGEFCIFIGDDDYEPRWKNLWLWATVCVLCGPCRLIYKMYY